MSIGKRLFNFARSELNSLLDRAADIDDERPAADDNDRTADPSKSQTNWGEAFRKTGRKVRLEDLSDEELEAEIERRRLEKEIDDRAAKAAETTGRTAPPPPRDRVSTPFGAGMDPVAKAYAALEVPPGSDFETVRKAYRTLMRKYHPDRHTASPEKQKAANELAQKLSDAYKTLEKRLRKPTAP